MNDERAAQTQHAERLRKFFDKIRGIDTHYLAGGARGIGQRAEQVENRAQTQLAASSLHVLHRRMHGGGEKKRDSYLFQTGRDLRDRQVDVHAQRFHHVGGAALRGHAAVAMLGDAYAGSSDDEGGCRRNIERAAGIATGAAGIDERVAPGAAGVEDGVGVEFEWNSGGADGFGKSDDFFDRFALHVQGHEQRGNLCVRALAGEDFGHHRVRLFAGERLTVNGDTMEDVEDHKIQATAETRLLSNRISVAVSVFGGHCRPSVSAIASCLATGAKPIQVPQSRQARWPAPNSPPSPALPRRGAAEMAENSTS